MGKVKSVLFVILLVVVFAILPFYVGHFDTKVDKAKGDLSVLSKALELYYEKVGVYPSTKDGLKSLVESEKFLDNLPKDPWGKPYYYKSPGVKNTNKYDLWSFGKDAKPGGEDENADVVNW
jgi:general secretion pathway protein G